MKEETPSFFCFFKKNMLVLKGNLKNNFSNMANLNEMKAPDPNMNLKVSGIILAVVILVSVLLGFYNKYLVWNIDSLNTQITEQSTKMAQLQSDKKIELYTLITGSKSFLEKYKKLSDIPTYISTIKLLSRDYSVQLTGFAYDAGNVSAKFLAQSDEVSYAYVKTKNFLEYFRKKDENMFSLDFVSSFEGQSQITFGTQFKLK